MHSILLLIAWIVLQTVCMINELKKLIIKDRQLLNMASLHELQSRNTEIQINVFLGQRANTVFCTFSYERDTGFEVFKYQVLSVLEKQPTGEEEEEEDLLLIDKYGCIVDSQDDFDRLLFINNVGSKVKSTTRSAATATSVTCEGVDVWCIALSANKLLTQYCTRNISPEDAILQPTYRLVDTTFRVCCRCKKFLDPSFLIPATDQAVSAVVTAPLLPSSCDIASVIEFGMAPPVAHEELQIEAVAFRALSSQSNSDSNTALFLKKEALKSCLKQHVPSSLLATALAPEQCSNFRRRLEIYAQTVLRYEDVEQQRAARAVVDFEKITAYATERLQKICEEHAAAAAAAAASAAAAATSQQPQHGNTTSPANTTTTTSSTSSMIVDLAKGDCGIGWSPAERLQHENDAAFFGLLRWFKLDFFKWTTKPPCTNPLCVEYLQHGRGNMESLGMAEPSMQEIQLGGAGRCELYSCKLCQQQTRFPRYNNALYLLQHSRMGRCGEFANAFCLLLRSLSMDARYVMDFTDHVWCEVWIPHLRKYVHIDPCERAIDAPLSYESGWGKKLTHVITFSRFGVTDATARYSRKMEEVICRRHESVVNENFAQEQIKECDAMLEQRFLATATAASATRARRHSEHKASSDIRTCEEVVSLLSIFKTGRAAFETTATATATATTSSSLLPSSSLTTAIAQSAATSEPTIGGSAYHTETIDERICVPNDLSIASMRMRKWYDSRDLDSMCLTRVVVQQLRGAETEGRSSGDVEWKAQRGEMGGGGGGGGSNSSSSEKNEGGERGLLLFDSIEEAKAGKAKTYPVVNTTPTTVNATIAAAEIEQSGDSKQLSASSAAAAADSNYALSNILLSRYAVDNQLVKKHCSFKYCFLGGKTHGDTVPFNTSAFLRSVIGLGLVDASSIQLSSVSLIAGTSLMNGVQCGFSAVTTTTTATTVVPAPALSLSTTTTTTTTTPQPVVGLSKKENEGDTAAGSATDNKGAAAGSSQRRRVSFFSPKCSSTHDSPTLHQLNLRPIVDERIVAVSVRFGDLVDSVTLEISTSTGEESGTTTATTKTVAAPAAAASADDAAVLFKAGGSGGGQVRRVEIPAEYGLCGFFGGTGGHLHNIGIVLRPIVETPFLLLPNKENIVRRDEGGGVRVSNSSSTSRTEADAGAGAVTAMEGGYRAHLFELARKECLWDVDGELTFHSSIFPPFRQGTCDSERSDGGDGAGGGSGVSMLLCLLEYVLTHNTRDRSSACFATIVKYCNNILNSPRDHSRQTVKTQANVFVREVKSTNGGVELFCFSPAQFYFHPGTDTGSEIETTASCRSTSNPSSGSSSNSIIPQNYLKSDLHLCAGEALQKRTVALQAYSNFLTKVTTAVVLIK